MLQTFGVIGATSPVGGHVIRQLAHRGHSVTAFSRREVRRPMPGVKWRVLDQTTVTGDSAAIENWIFVAQIWLLPQYFELLERCGARRVVAVSSTSLFTKTDSTDDADRALSSRLQDAESRIAAWADERQIAWTVLRPTMIYGNGLDNNVAAIAKFVRKFRFFPLLGKAQGLRQPVHAEDVAQACVASLNSSAASQKAYNISGAEILTYQEMVRRVFAALGMRARMPRIPLAAIKCGIYLVRPLPGFTRISPAMAERMNKDMIFDHSEATKDFSFSPRAFSLTAADVSAPVAVDFGGAK